MTNNSSSTKSDLNNKTKVMVPPALGKLGAKKILLLLLTVVVFAVMVKLGFWQLDRGQQKQLLEQQLHSWQQATPVDIATALESDAEITGKKVTVQLAPIPVDRLAVKRVYWDNHTWQGKVGYVVFQPVKLLDSGLSSNSSVVLLELGFVRAGQDRNVLPQVAGVMEPQRIEGRLYRRQENPMSEGLMSESMPQFSAIRIQNLALEQLGQTWQLDVLPYAIQPLSGLELIDDNGQPVSDSLPHPWEPVPLSSKRHFGYALQWFSMALVLLLLVALFVYRAMNSKSKYEKENPNTEG